VEVINSVEVDTAEEEKASFCVENKGSERVLFVLSSTFFVRMGAILDGGDVDNSEILSLSVLIVAGVDDFVKTCQVVLVFKEVMAL